jgi:hypothetical protein
VLREVFELAEVLTRGGAQGRTLLSHRNTVNLRRIEPRHALESNAEEDVVEEEERHTGAGNLVLMCVSWFFVVAQEHGDDKVTEALSSGSVHDHLATAPSFHVGNTNH